MNILEFDFGTKKKKKRVQEANDTSEIISNNTSEIISKIISNNTSKITSEIISNDTSEITSEIISNDTSEIISNDTSEIISNDTSEIRLNDDNNLLPDDYKELLDRAYSLINEKNPSCLSNLGKNFSIIPPQVVKDGSKKTMFVNIEIFAKKLNRDLEHFVTFILAELSTTGSLDGQNRLSIRGKYYQIQVEAIIKRYINEYVKCKSCKSPDTTIVKKNRLVFLACNQCNTEHSVSVIKNVQIK
jgi:translation initiation factor 2 subunit 2